MRHVITTLAMLAAFTGAAPANTLTGETIKNEIIGRRIYLAAPLGGEFPLNYRPSGVVDGSGEALGLGRWIQPKDRGRWWISGNRLCQRFEVWYKGASMCFDLTRLGPKKLRWVRDNGESGTARIGPAID